MSKFSMVQVNRIYLIFNLVHFLVDSSVSNYIMNNVFNWESDCFYPKSENK